MPYTLCTKGLGSNPNHEKCIDLDNEIKNW